MKVTKQLDLYIRYLSADKNEKCVCYYASVMFWLADTIMDQWSYDGIIVYCSATSSDNWVV